MKRMSTKRMWREAGASYLFLSPTLFVLLLFIIGPIWFAIFLAFHKVQLLGMTLPLARPALAAQAIFVFMGSCNDFMRPLIILSDPQLFTLLLGLNSFKGQYISYWNYIMAASMVFTLPVLVIYAFFNRYFIKGISFTGGK